MADPIEFGSFYKLLRDAIDGNSTKIKELEWVLAEYEHAKEAKNPFDELGQIFCHHGVMELYDYTGIEDISYIKKLEESIWRYLNFRMKMTLKEYMLNSMIKHAKTHKLSEKLANKWSVDIDDIEVNIEDLALYVTDGILEIIR